MPGLLNQRCRELLSELKLIQPYEPIQVKPLSGGVASDIAAVHSSEYSWCVKFALAKLRVRSDWYAPVHRNNAEYAYLQFAANVAPDSAVGLYGQSATLNGFVMDYLQGDDIYLWKDALLAGWAQADCAVQLGDLLGRIHAASARSLSKAGVFENAADFKALRIEPYLLHTAKQHPDVDRELHAMADMLYSACRVLVHGDVSPKNILFRRQGPVLLDAECATLGDASFDPAFCINHLILKAIHLKAQEPDSLEHALGLWNAYRTHVHWESAAALEERICRLVPCLMLARVDGKSPVEYLNATDQQRVRCLAKELFQHPVLHLDQLLAQIAASLDEPD